MNKVVLIGNITNDIELKQAASGTMTAHFRLGVFRSRKNGESVSDFINCTAFGTNAEFISKYFGKGNRIGIEGNIKTGSYNDKTTGKKVYTTEIWVEKAEFIDRKPDNPEPQNAVQPSVRDDSGRIPPAPALSPAPVYAPAPAQNYPQDYGYPEYPYY